MPKPSLRRLVPRLTAFLPGTAPLALLLAAWTGTFAEPPAARSPEPVLKARTYAADTSDFPNPERGFHRFRSLTRPTGFALRSENRTLVYGEIDATAHKGQDFPAAFLAQVEAGFAEARRQGIKVNPRVVYSHAIGEADAPLDQVLRHIALLKPLWEANRDVINVLDPGFVGA